MTIARFILCATCIILSVVMIGGAFLLAHNPNTTDAAAFTYVILASVFGGSLLIGAYEIFAIQQQRPVMRRNRYCNSSN